MLEKTAERARHAAKRFLGLTSREISSILLAVALGLFYLFVGDHLREFPEAPQVYHITYGAVTVLLVIYLMFQSGKIAFGKSERSLDQMLDHLFSGGPLIVNLLCLVSGKITNSWEITLAVMTSAVVLFDLFFIGGFGTTKATLTDEVATQKGD